MTTTPTTNPPPPTPALSSPPSSTASGLRRLRAAETQAWRYQSDNKYSDPQKYPLGQSVTSNPNSFSKLQYRLDATRRARCLSLDALAKHKTKPSAPPAAA